MSSAERVVFILVKVPAEKILDSKQRPAARSRNSIIGRRDQLVILFCTEPWDRRLPDIRVVMGYHMMSPHSVTKIFLKCKLIGFRKYRASYLTSSPLMCDACGARNPTVYLPPKCL